MKNYRITVNGTVYDVTVEETNGSETPVQRTAAPKAAPKAAPAPKAAAGSEGAVKVTAPMPGKILGIKVNAGDTVAKGQVLMILEAMKMENEIVAPQDGTVAGVHVTVGSMVEAGEVLASLD